MTYGFKSLFPHHCCGFNSVVECHLAKVKVASSNLVSRSIETLMALGFQGFFASIEKPGKTL